MFMEQRATGTLRIWAEPFTPLRVPKIFNLRRDPYERADITSNTYYDWMISTRLRSRAGAGLCRQVPGDLQSLSASAKAGQLHRRWADGSPGEGAVAARRRH